MLRLPSYHVTTWTTTLLAWTDADVDCNIARGKLDACKIKQKPKPPRVVAQALLAHAEGHTQMG